MEFSDAGIMMVRIYPKSGHIDIKLLMDYNLHHRAPSALSLPRKAACELALTSPIIMTHECDPQQLTNARSGLSSSPESVQQQAPML